MSLASMTGFGRGEASGAGILVQVEIKSVNHRYLDARVQLPRELGRLEPVILRLLKQSLSRGRVEAQLRIQRDQEASPSPQHGLDLEAGSKLVGTLRELQRQLDLPGELSISDLATFVDRFTVASEPLEVEAVEETVLAGVSAACTDLIKARAVEGAALAADILERHQVISGLVAEIRSRVPEVVEAAASRLDERVNRLLERRGVELDEGRLAQEVALLADRSDVHEELQRLEQHLVSLAEVVSGDGSEPVGRRIDFLGQELMREINTIGSKVSDTSVTGFVIDVRSEIERIREQAQNVE